MSEFTLDTSGHVNLGKAAFPFHNEYVEWPDLSPFVQGYVEALFASLGPYDWKDEYGGAWPSKFSDLDPSALALILRDCEAAQEQIRTGDIGVSGVGPREQGAALWNECQRGRWRDQHLRPLQPYLSDEGRVCLRKEPR